MTTNSSSSSGNNWSGIIIALIGAISSIAVTWLTIQHSVGAASPAAPVQMQGMAPAVIASPSGSQNVILPDLRKMAMADARQQLEAHGLAVIVTTVADQQPAETVLTTNPQPGVTVTTGSTVMLYVSAGSASITSPAVSPPPDEKRSKGKKDD